MTIEYFEPMAAPNTPNTKPFILSSHGEGCGAGSCKCSEGYWLSISDGEKGVKFKFETLSEMQDFKYNLHNTGR